MKPRSIRDVKSLSSRLIYCALLSGNRLVTMLSQATQSTNGEIQTSNIIFATNEDKHCIFAVYLTMVSVYQIKCCGMVSEYLAGNVEEEEVVAYTYYSSISLAGLKTTKKYLSGWSV